MKEHMKQQISAEVRAFFSAAGRKGGTKRWAGTTKKQRHEEALVRTRKAAITRAKNKKEKVMKSQTSVLAKLPAPALARVAVILAALEEQGGTKC